MLEDGKCEFIKNSICKAHQNHMRVHLECIKLTTRSMVQWFKCFCGVAVEFESLGAIT